MAPVAGKGATNWQKPQYSCFEEENCIRENSKVIVALVEIPFVCCNIKTECRVLNTDFITRDIELGILFVKA